MVILGFLENQSFVNYSENRAKYHGVSSTKIREDQCSYLQKLFGDRSIPFDGPIADFRCGVGNYFFKVPSNPRLEQLKKAEKELRRYVLRQLGIPALTLPLDGYKKFLISLGVLVKNDPDDKDMSEISFFEDNVLDFDANVAAFLRQRENRFNKPYFMIINDEFEKQFPVDDGLDRT